MYIRKKKFINTELPNLPDFPIQHIANCPSYASKVRTKIKHLLVTDVVEVEVEVLVVDVVEVEVLVDIVDVVVVTVVVLPTR